MDHVTTIYKEDARYPQLLSKIADPPQQLYCRGNVSLLGEFCVAVVGTRKASDYGLRACGDIAGGLAAAGVVVVSGLALGVDAAAHRATLDAAGQTIAVLGSGVGDDTMGPPSNIPLAHDILAKGGLIISEYPVGQEASAWSFPQRNRIISGISRGVVVIEADKDSGSLITAKSALDQDRDVFAVPGSIYWPRSVGTNWLITQGARPVSAAKDVLDAYQLEQLPLPEQIVSTRDPLETRILALLRENGPMHQESLVAASDSDASHVMAAITHMELRGDIRQYGSGTYALT